MDDSENLDSLSKLFAHSYRRYCALVLTHPRPSSYFLKIVGRVILAMQIFALVVNPDSEAKLPWIYSDIRYVWIGFAVVSRPDFIAKAYNQQLVCSVIFLTILATALALKCGIMIRIMKNTSQLTTNAEDAQSLRPEFMTLECLMRYILFELGYIPCLYSLISTSSLLSYSNPLSYNLLISFLSSFYLILCIEDSLYMQQVFWTDLKSDSIISIPLYILAKRVSILIIIYTTSHIDFPTQWLEYSLILISFGTLIIFLFYKNLPYSNFNRNFEEVSKGILLLWGGVVTFYAGWRKLGQEYSTATLIYIIPLVFMILLNRQILLTRYARIVNLENGRSLNKLFHILLRRSRGELKEVDMDKCIKVYMKEFEENVYITMWLCYYYLEQNQFLPVKILLSNISKQHKSWQILSYEQVIIHHLKVEAVKDQDENEAVTYIEFCQKLATLLNQDKKSCKIMHDFYIELLTNSSESTRISKLIEKVNSTVRSAHHFYKKLSSLYNYNPKVLDYYAGFLDAIENSLDHKNALIRAIQADYEEATRYDAMEASARYFDSRNLILVVSLNPDSLGQILWLKNSRVLGYENSDLEDSSFKALVPEPIRSFHDPLFAKSSDIWSKHVILTGLLSLVVVSREQYLTPVLIKARMVNLNNCSLAVILVLKHNLYGYLEAYLSTDGRYICGLVIYIQTMQLSIVLCEFMKVEENKLASIDMLEYAKAGEWETGLKICEGLCAYTSSYVYVKTCEVPIGAYTQKTLILLNPGILYIDNTPVLVKDFKMPESFKHLATQSTIPTYKVKNYHDLLGEQSPETLNTNKEMHIEEDFTHLQHLSSSTSKQEYVLNYKKKMKSAVLSRIRHLKIGLLLFVRYR